MRQVCVFVDGENFRRSIGTLFPDGFDRNEYLPKQAQWEKFFDWLTDEICGHDAQRLRTYWHVIETVDFFPYKIPAADREPETLYRLLCRHKPFKEILAEFKPNDCVDRMAEIARELQTIQQRFERRFKGWRVLQDGISKRHAAVEFRRAGAIRYDLFSKQLGEEKAVDVMLATDLITLKDIYDIAIIVSGDQDFVPAVQAVKNAGKTVVNVAFLTQTGKLLPGGARRLNERTDRSFEIQHDQFRDFLGLRR